jgi:queuine tRNA-ribosyltransferase
VVLRPKVGVNVFAVSRLNFQIEGRSPGTDARAGSFTTLHGAVQTPVFMPVGTQATVKSQTVESLRDAGSRVLLANTYHLLLRPGAEVFRRFGGIHRFMNWDGPVLTDSGGFQIFSLPNSREMNEEGARFQSYLDGKTHLLSPEESVGMQKAIGSDIMMVLDQCIRSTAERSEALAAMELTHRWAWRSLEARGDSPQSLFGIVQGACFPDLRKRSAEFLTQLPLDGFAIGGLAVGESKEQREEFCGMTAALLPQHLPRYLMGVGTPLDILEAVHRGVDMFDCIMPSQIAQRGGAFTSQGRLQLRRTTYKFAEEALDPDCTCVTCRDYSRAYLHHLHKTGEHLGWTLITQHNLTFYHRLMREIRAHILAGTFLPFYNERRELLAISDNEFDGPPKPTRVRKRPVMQLGDYDLFLSHKGFYSIRQISSGQIMHSVSEPTEEAELLYVDQSRLSLRLQEATEDPLVLWDVGLGAATNAMGAVQCYEALKAQGAKVRPLRIVSFDTDLDPMRLALKHPGYFKQMRHGAPHKLLKTGSYSADGLEWTFIEGDFAQNFDKAPLPDIIFYDMFSSKATENVGLWSPAHFSRLFQYTVSRPCGIYTYSASTAVRAALLSAGFFVAKGIPTPPKAETTTAFNHRPSADMLGADWLDRWNRSHVKFPEGIEDHARAHFETRIVTHPQFVD